MSNHTSSPPRQPGPPHHLDVWLDAVSIAIIAVILILTTMLLWQPPATVWVA